MRVLLEEVCPLDDYDFISTIVKKPSIAKTLTPRNRCDSFSSVGLLRQITSDVSELGERLIGIPHAAPSLPAANKKRYKGNRN